MQSTRRMGDALGYLTAKTYPIQEMPEMIPPYSKLDVWHYIMDRGCPTIRRAAGNSVQLRQLGALNGDQT